MITTIIKRDGTSEPFSAEKINGWGEWAARSLGGHVDWPTVVMRTVAGLPDTCTSEDLQNALIRQCLNMNSWSHNRMAGRLYASNMYRAMYGKGNIPTIREVHSRLQAVGMMIHLDYSDAEYAELEKVIKHKRDFNYPHFQLEIIRTKYALQNRVDKVEYESPQFVYMRMAMALDNDQPRERRMHDVKRWYEHFSKNRINAPTPNYVNLGTKLNGYASCCLYSVNDTAASIGAGMNIAYTMTYMSAGIGNIHNTRSVGDPVRGGMIAHMGKLPYYRALVEMISCNMQNGRAGAGNTFYSAFDPEVETIMRLKNPLTPTEKQIRGIDYTQIGNKFLGRKVARDEQVFLFNCWSAPDLFQAFFSGDEKLFAELYAKYEADPTFKKKYVKAREVVITALNEASQTGRAYLAFADEINRHTPYKDTIYLSNLCVEIVEPTEGYDNSGDLYSTGPVGYIKFRTTDGKDWSLTADDLLRKPAGAGYVYALHLKEGESFSYGGQSYTVSEVTDLKKEPEVALCSLAAIVISNIKSDEEYEDAMYYSLLMIDKCIHMSDYELPHIGYTAKNRLAAAVGMMDLAHYMAERKLKYSSPEGKAEIHRVAESHMYFALRASLRLAKELGNCPWSHRTKWADGWLPIDTYNRSIDQVVAPEYQRDWEGLRADIIEQGGIRNSTVVAYMPGESSSKASGCSNSIYPVRDTTLVKTDNGVSVYWAAPNSERLAKYYELAWDIPTHDMIDNYGIFQKFCDQSISADFWRRIEGTTKISSDEMLSDYFHMLKRGMKTRYYQNSKTSKAVVLDVQEEAKFTITADKLKELGLDVALLQDVGVITPAANAGEFHADPVQIQALVAANDPSVEEIGGDERGCGSGGCAM